MQEIRRGSTEAMLRIGQIASAASALLAAGMILTASAVAEQCPAPRESRSTEFGDARRPNRKIDLTEQSSRSYTGHDLGRSPKLEAAFQRLRLVREGATSDSGWSLTLRDEQQRVLQVVRPSDFSAPGAAAGVWTRFLKAGTVTFDLFAEPGADVALLVSEAIVLSNKAYVPRYSWQGATAQYIPLYQFMHSDVAAVRRAGDRIAFLVGRDQAEISGAFRGVSWCCSGLLLSDTLLLTNWHCGGRSMTLPDDQMWRDDSDGRICDSLMINMAWDDASPSREARCDKVEHKDKSLDYAILRVAPVPGGLQTLSTGRPVRFAGKRPASGDLLRIIHHPECLEKRVSFNCAVDQAARPSWDGAATHAASEFSHRCDTEGGSSGSPVFNVTGELVGLHHLGHEVIPGDASLKCDKRNKAVHIDSIMADLKARKPDLYGEIKAATVGLSD
jgi:Trypsin-like peptidase domain